METRLMDDQRGSPETESLEVGLAGLLRIYGITAFAALLSVATADLHAYRDGSRAVPDVVIARISFLVQITDDLAGSYDSMGMRRWWERPRTTLGGRSPRAALGPDWDPEGPVARTIARFAAGLTGGT
jgi:hypothetical protein